MMSNPSNIGGKAAGLKQLSALGFNVPDFVLITDLKASRSLTEAFIEAHPGHKYAVRSSNALEDGQNYSFAGQFESYLNLKPEEIAEKIRECFESAENSRVQAYADQKVKGSSVGKSNMNVILQCMVDADFAGVAFSVDPTNQRRDLCLIQYTEGLGDKLVDGKVEAQTLQICKRAADTSLEGQEQASVFRELYEGLILLEQAQGYPVDIEWAVDRSGKLHWLQMRPVTSLEEFHPNEFDSELSFEGEHLTRANIGEMMPCFMRPLTITTFGRAIEVGIQHFYKECGILDNYTDKFLYIKFYYNHGFISIGNLYEIADALILPKYEFVEFSLLSRSLNDRVTNGKKRSLIRQYINQFKQIRYLSKAAKRLQWIQKTTSQTHAPEGKDPMELYSWIDQHLDTLNTIYAYHYCTSARSGTMFTTLLSIISGQALPKEGSDATVAHFMKDIPDIEGYKVIQALLGIQEALKHELPAYASMNDQALLDYLQNNEGGASIAFKSFLALHGHHCVREAELSEKDWNQDPLPLMMMLKVDQKSTRAKSEQDLKALARKQLPEAGWLKRRLFLSFVKKARKAVWMRESSKSSSIKFQQKLKYAYLDIAGYLVRQKLLKQTEDIFYLKHQEIGLLLSGKLKSPMQRIEQRRGHESLFRKMRFEELYAGLPYPVLEESQLDSKGAVVSQGKANGKVKLIRSLEDAKRLEPGDIMVCQYTDIGWTPYFTIISGLITEIGSALSHGAVVAREYGIPAIVNYGNALSHFKEGQVLSIDTGRDPVIE